MKISEFIAKKKKFLQTFNIYTEESIRFGTHYDHTGSKTKVLFNLNNKN